jgi:hypothetical protein
MTQLAIWTDEERARQRLKQPIVSFLNKRFPVVAWDALVDLKSGTACIVATDISIHHGYYIYLNENVHVMQSRLSNVGGGILERFGIRTHQDLLDLPRRMDGEALNAAKGER